jgi:hypothetical protein
MEKKTKIYVIGDFTKEQLSRLIKEIWKIQKEVNPKNKKDKMFLIWVSNDVFTDAEIREMIKNNFKDIKVLDLVEMSGNDILKGKTKMVCCLSGCNFLFF